MTTSADRSAATGDGPARAQAPRDGRKPAWLKHKAPAPRQYRATGALLDELDLHTVCREARCPNKGECYSSGTATFLILGDVCTRACAFCAVEGEEKTGNEARVVRPPDDDEPRRVAEAARRLGLRHVVITSVTRDDLPDGGATQFAAAVTAVREAVPAATVEVLIPDLGGDEAALAVVLAARPDVLNHNLETAPRLYAQVRPQARYDRSLELLARAAAWARSPAAASAAGDARAHTAAPGDARAHTAAPGRPLVKTGLMVGLGESDDEVAAVLADAAAAGADAVTIGQYLQPRAGCTAVARYVTPEQFAGYRRRGEALGLTMIADPFVRSSYKAGQLLERRA